MKKILATLIAVFMVIGMAGCSNTSAENEGMEPVDIEQVEAVQGSTIENIVMEESTKKADPDYDEDMDSDNANSEDASIDESQSNYVSTATSLRNQVFTKISPFSEERAWVEYWDDGQLITSVINTNGEIVFTLDREVDYYYDFHDGFAYYLYTPDSTKEREEYLDNVAVCIIDREGKVTYDSQNDDIRAVLAYGDGYFFAIRHVSTFDIDEWSSGCIDKDGNALTEFETYDTNEALWLPLYRSTYDKGYFDQYFRYLGEGIFYLYSGNSGKIYSARERKIISDFVATGTKVGNYQNGHMLYMGDPKIFVLDTDGIKNTLESTIKPRTNFDKPNVFLSGFSEDMCFYDHAYYDSDANVKIDLSKYADKKIAGGMFNQGYAPLYIEGADGKDYFTIIDSQGNEIFSPISGSPTNSFEEGLLVVQLESGCALFNTAGEKVLDTPYSVARTMAHEERSLGDWTANDSPYTVSDGYFITCKEGNSIPTVFVGVDGSYIGQ